MIFLTSAAVHDWRSAFSSSITAALQANSITARRPKSVFAKGHTFENHVARCDLYCSRIWLGARVWAARSTTRTTQRSPAWMANTASGQRRELRRLLGLFIVVGPISCPLSTCGGRFL